MQQAALRNFPWHYIKRIFIDFGYHRTMKIFTIVYFILYSGSLLLDLYYLFNNFSIAAMVRYGCMIMLISYVIAGMLFCFIFEKQLLNLLSEAETIFWPPEMITSELPKFIHRTNVLNYFIIAWFGLLGVILFPVWGDQSEWFLNVWAYKAYFGSWWYIPYNLFYYSQPMAAWTCVRLPFIMMYFSLQIKLQIFLLNQQILEIPKGHNTNSETAPDDLSYQEAVSQKMCLCISHNVKIKRWTKSFLRKVIQAMPVFVLLGILGSIFVTFSVLYSFESTSTILKIRLVVVVGCTILSVYMFVEGSQRLCDESSQMFEMLAYSPWYLYNKNNRRILLTFMTNTLEPITITWGGIILNYNFGLTVRLQTIDL
ncbi:odorant receptor 234 [Tribolium castaneum]|uniref:Odorant receptor n=1 Tax=Tribolium castaneum TaxID=7070 RepID=D7EIQ8_TRICA|nr:odorant receptor 234 [Tribolium castaneum]